MPASGNPTWVDEDPVTHTSPTSADAQALNNIEAAVAGSVSKAGDTITGSVTLQSSYAGDDVAGGIDSTSRLNLQSYQRAAWNSFGEVIRIYSKRWDSKQMIAWYGPKSYDSNGDPVGSDKPWFWMGAHYEANDHGSVHGHWSCEVPDTTGALQTRLEMPIWDPITGVYGMDKGVIKTNAADFNVRTSNGQEFRLSASAGTEKPITFSNSSNGEDGFRRWKIRATNDAESGANAGTNLQIVRYDDSGVLLDQPVAIDRATGTVAIGGTSGTAGGLTVRRNTGVAATVTSTLAGGTAIYAVGADAPSRAFQADVSGDANRRVVIYADGKTEWGDGTAARDTNLYRSAANVLRTDDSLHVDINLRLHSTSLGSGVGVIAIGNATTAPTTAPTGGGVLYAEGGALKWIGPSGTPVTIAAA